MANEKCSDFMPVDEVRDEFQGQFLEVIQIVVFVLKIEVIDSSDLLHC